MVRVNLIGQDGICFKNGVPPVRYDAIRKGLTNIQETFLHSKVHVHMPRIGCGLAGGDWAIVEKMINETLVGMDV